MDNNSLMIVTHNGTAVLEYYRDKPLPEQQLAYLEKMDRSMDNGISIGERQITSPTADERLEFVAGQLYQALIADNDPMIAAMCAYLALRKPDAAEIKFLDNEEAVSIEILTTRSEGRVDGVPVTLN